MPAGLNGRARTGRISRHSGDGAAGAGVGMVIDRLEDGRIKDTRIIMDTLGMMGQLGDVAGCWRGRAETIGDEVGRRL